MRFLKLTLLILFFSITVSNASTDKDTQSIVIVSEIKLNNIDSTAEKFFSDTIRSEISKYSQYKVISRDKMHSFINKEEITKARL